MYIKLYLSSDAKFISSVECEPPACQLVAWAGGGQESCPLLGKTRGFSGRLPKILCLPDPWLHLHGCYILIIPAILLTWLSICRFCFIKIFGYVYRIDNDFRGMSLTWHSGWVDPGVSGSYKVIRLGFLSTVCDSF